MCVCAHVRVCLYTQIRTASLPFCLSDLLLVFGWSSPSCGPCPISDAGVRVPLCCILHRLWPPPPPLSCASLSALFSGFHELFIQISWLWFWSPPPLFSCGSCPVLCTSTGGIPLCSFAALGAPPSSPVVSRPQPTIQLPHFPQVTNCHHIKIHNSWRLNERHYGKLGFLLPNVSSRRLHHRYHREQPTDIRPHARSLGRPSVLGALTGLSKEEAKVRFGEEMLHLYRRGFHVQPMLMKEVRREP